jgi:benzoate membrane transport protein
MVEWSLAAPRLAPLELTPAAVVAVTLPVVAFSLTTAPRGLAVLIDQQYPIRIDRVIVAIGAATMVNALFGGGPGGLSNEGGAVLAGPDAGPRERRYLAAALAGLLMLGIALLAESLASVLQALPGAYLTALIGLALLRLVADGFRRMFGGPLKLAPLVTFVVATSSLTIAGVGAVVWALVIGLAVAILVELPDLRRVWQETGAPG